VKEESAGETGVEPLLGGGGEAALQERIRELEKELEEKNKVIAAQGLKLGFGEPSDWR
jgi:hypothetical protein